MSQHSAAPTSKSYDATVIGSGPNGLAAAILLAQAGQHTLLIEAAPTVGGGMRTAELTLPGFRHDICSAVHPTAQISPFFRSLNLEKFGLTWSHPEIPLAHPLEDGGAAVLHRDLVQTAAELPADDGRAYRRLFAPLTADLPALAEDLLTTPLHFPKHPFRLARFGLPALRSAVALAKSRFHSAEAQALIAGNAAHSILPLETSGTAAIGLVLAAAGHAVGWPVARGGSQAIADALAAQFRALGGEIITDWKVTNRAELPASRVTLFDTNPHRMVEICQDTLPLSYHRKLRSYRYGPAVFKMDLALSAPIPWKNAACRLAGTVHVGGTLEEIAHSERACWESRLAEKPYVLVAQASVCDATRAPVGQHTCWAYCHVPHGFAGDASASILSQIERFAPGFRDTILASHTMNPVQLEAYNANYRGGDIIGGMQDLWQIIKRPVFSFSPWSTPACDVFLCSSSTPPGGGVHGMSGWHAARLALRRLGAPWHHH